MITIDGSKGEGGGQILRSSLALALLTQTPLQLLNIRAGRARPGLLRQHLTAVKAAARLGRARVEGLELYANALTFFPGAPEPGSYQLDIGSAGSASLVLQTVLPVALLTPGPTTWRIGGGTHNKAAPPFNYMKRAFAPLIERMGARLDLEMTRPGFYPKGGGQLTARVHPAERLQPLRLGARGQIHRISATVVLAGRVPNHVAERALQVVRERVEVDPERCTVVRLERSLSPGMALFIEVESDALTEVFTGFGERKLQTEEVAERLLTREVLPYLSVHDAAVGPHLADQLLLPLALAGAGTFTMVAPTLHFRTNADTIQRFIPGTSIDYREVSPGCWRVDVSGEGRALLTKQSDG